MIAQKDENSSILSETDLKESDHLNKSLEISSEEYSQNFDSLSEHSNIGKV